MNEEVTKKILGLSIKNARELRGLTQDKLSSMINLDATNLSRIENGKSSPSFKTFCAIIEALKIEPNTLLDFLSFNSEDKKSSDLELFENIKNLPENIKKAVKDFVSALSN